MNAPRFFCLLALAACSPIGATSPPDAPASVRAHLAEPTRLVAAASASAGALTAGRNTFDGWQTGSASLALASGELDARVDADGQLVLTTLALRFDPIEIPTNVFKQPVELRELELDFVRASAITTQWVDENDANVSATVELELGATLVVAGNELPLGPQHLPALTLTLALSGDGDAVDASLDLIATGTLWSWADLFELTALSFAVTVASS